MSNARFKLLAYINGRQRTFVVYTHSKDDAEKKLKLMFETEEDYIALVHED